MSYVELQKAFPLVLILIGGILVLSCQKNEKSKPVDNLNAEVEVQLNYRIDYFIQLYGSKEALEIISGKNIAQLKEENRESIRAQIISTKLNQNFK